MLVDAPAKLKMIKEIMFSTWRACCDPHSMINDHPFVADAIIANPVACECSL